jgi:hypothetical protein
MNGQRGYVVPNPLGAPEVVSWEAASRARFRPQANKNDIVAAMTAVIHDRERWAAIRPALAKESKQRFSAKTCAEQHAIMLRRAAQVAGCDRRPLPSVSDAPVGFPN